MRNILAILMLLPSLAVAQQRDQFGQISRHQVWGREQIDLETYSRGRYGRPCNCPMCNVINGWRSQYYSQRNQPRPQEPIVRVSRPVISSPAVVVDEYKQAVTSPSSEAIQLESIRLMNVQPDDVLIEPGCGIAEMCCKFVAAGGKLAIGIEIYPDVADKARKHIQRQVNAGRIPPGSVVVVPGDIHKLDLTRYGATVAYCYLDEPDLRKLSAKGAFENLRCVVSPQHSIDGLAMGVTECGADRIYQYIRGVTPDPEPFVFVDTPPVASPSRAAVIAPAVPAVELWTAADFMLEMQTWSSGCPHCVRWKTNESNRVRCAVTEKYTSGSAPSFRLKIRWPRGGNQWRELSLGNGQVVGWTGYTSADTINRQIQAEIDARNRGNNQ